KQGIMEFQNREPAASMTVRPESIEPLSLHFAVVGLAILVGYLILQFLVCAERVTIGSDFMTYITLFPLAMVRSIFVQGVLTKIDRTKLIDRRMTNRS